MMKKSILLAIGMGVVMSFTAHGQQRTPEVAGGDSLSVQTTAALAVVSTEQAPTLDSLTQNTGQKQPTKRDLRRIRRISLTPRGVAKEQEVSNLGASRLTPQSVVPVQSESMAADSTLGAVGFNQPQVMDMAAARSHGRFLPTSRRIDRQVNRGRFVYKGELMAGFTASYGKLSSEDTQFLVILNNIDLDGKIASVKPFLGYFYRDNRCFGVRFGYQHMSGKLGNIDFDLGEQNDLALSLSGMGFVSDSYEVGLFHRAYVGLDSKGIFGLFAEVEASIMTGASDFTNGEGDAARMTRSENFKAKLAFNPGMSVYIFPNVCTSVSIGLGGIQYTAVTQRDAQGNKIGSRTASKMAFRINIFEINFGVSIHLWDKKKR